VLFGVKNQVQLAFDARSGRMIRCEGEVNALKHQITLISNALMEEAVFFSSYFVDFKFLYHE
jgi:hypothetical protein